MGKVFIYWDNSNDFYESVTFLVGAAPGQPVADARYAKPVDMARRTGA